MGFLLATGFLAAVVEEEPKENRGLDLAGAAVFLAPKPKDFLATTGFLVAGLGFPAAPYKLFTLAFLGAGLAGSFLPKKDTTVVAGSK